MPRKNNHVSPCSAGKVREGSEGWCRAHQGMSRSGVWDGRCVPSLQSKGLEDSCGSLQEVPSLPPSPSPSPPPPVTWDCPASMDSSARNHLSPWAGWALCLQSSGAGAGLNLVIPLLREPGFEGICPQQISSDG